jgi:hypothetical protein
VGADGGEGYNVNVAWDGEGLGDADYLAAFQQVLLPIAEEYGPDLVIVSAGFDAAQGDPIGGCDVTPACFGQLTGLLMGVAPVVLVLEGGYNLRATAEATEACVRVLAGEPPEPLPEPLQPSGVGLRGIATARYVQSQYWNCILAPEPPPGGPPIYGWQQLLAGWQGSEDDDATPGGSRLGRAGGARRAGGAARRFQGHRRQMQLLRSIHQSAIRAFWRRRQQLSKQQQLQQQQQRQRQEGAAAAAGGSAAAAAVQAAAAAAAATAALL